MEKEQSYWVLLMLTIPRGDETNVLCVHEEFSRYLFININVIFEKSLCFSFDTKIYLRRDVSRVVKRGPRSKGTLSNYLMSERR